MKVSQSSEHKTIINDVTFRLSPSKSLILEWHINFFKITGDYCAEQKIFMEVRMTLNSDTGAVLNFSHDARLHLIVAGAVTLLKRHVVDLIDGADISA